MYVHNTIWSCDHNDWSLWSHLPGQMYWLWLFSSLDTYPPQKCVSAGTGVIRCVQVKEMLYTCTLTSSSLHKWSPSFFHLFRCKFKMFRTLIAKTPSQTSSVALSPRCSVLINVAIFYSHYTFIPSAFECSCPKYFVFQVRSLCRKFLYPLPVFSVMCTNRLRSYRNAASCVARLQRCNKHFLFIV